MRKCLLIILTFIAVGSCNKFVEFKDFYVAFEPSASSATLVAADAAFTADYKLHLASAKRSKPLVVTFSVQAGDGLSEGVDYVLVTKGTTVEFYPGTYDKAIQVKWLNHAIDKSKDCTLTITLESANDDVLLGVPGPDNLNKSITIKKY